MKYIASCSGGKDSIATVILAHEHHEPLDIIIFSEVIFDKNISGEFPEHIDFIKNKAFPLFEKWGYETKILHAEKSYMDIFMSETKRGKRVGTGLKLGFPLALKCGINKPCKVKPIMDFINNCNHAITQYIGIASDEPKRLKRLQKSNIPEISLLEKYAYTEEMAFNLCRQYNLLSPIYEFTQRSGCWFCPLASDNTLRYLMKNYPELWNKLIILEERTDLINNMWNRLSGITIHNKEKQFFWEEKQIDIFNFHNDMFKLFK